MVIFSCVRSSGDGSGSGSGSGSDSGSGKQRGIGFLADVRRMNVGLTRARCSLWIVGHAATLQVRSPQPPALPRPLIQVPRYSRILLRRVSCMFFQDCLAAVKHQGNKTPFFP